MAAKTLYQCERRWDAWVMLLRYMHTELHFNARPIQQLLRDAAPLVEKQLPWLASFDDETAPICPHDLETDEREFACSFFSPLGTTDLDGQLQHIEWSAMRAEELRATAKERAKRLSKAYVMTGVCIGLCIGLLLI